MYPDRMTHSSDKELKNCHFGEDSRIVYWMQRFQRCVYDLEIPNMEYNRECNQYVKSIKCIIDANANPILNTTGYNFRLNYDRIQKRFTN